MTPVRPRRTASRALWVTKKDGERARNATGGRAPHAEGFAVIASDRTERPRSHCSRDVPRPCAQGPREPANAACFHPARTASCGRPGSEEAVQVHALEQIMRLPAYARTLASRRAAPAQAPTFLRRGQPREQRSLLETIRATFDPGRRTRPLDTGFQAGQHVQPAWLLPRA